MVDTWPDDGGWVTEMVVVRLQRFGERRMLPIGELLAVGDTLRAPYTRMQIDDSPLIEGGRYRADEPYRAIAYWRLEEHGKVTARWRRSSGFSATGRPFPTSPSPTPSAS